MSLFFVMCLVYTCIFNCIYKLNVYLNKGFKCLCQYMGYKYIGCVCRRAMTNVSDLSVVDIEFLQAARDINKNPETYKKTGNSVRPANTASIKRATDLTDEQVSYRMGGNSNSKGFEKGNKNLIVAHDPQVQGSTLGPRSVELTSHGLNMLNKAEKRMSRFAGVNKKEFEELEREVQKNREREELVNAINNMFKAINHKYHAQHESEGNWEILLEFTENTVDECVLIRKNYDTKDILIEVLRDEQDNSEEVIEWEEDRPFGEKIHRMCAIIRKVIGKNHDPDRPGQPE